MLIEDQYGIGDVVDLGVATGSVERITLRTTVLRGQDGTVWHVPNGEIRRVGNRSQAVVGRRARRRRRLRRRPRRRPRASSTTTAEAVCESEDYAGDVLAAPELLGVESVGAGGRARCACWSRPHPGAQFRLQRALREAIKAALDDAGVDGPPAAAARHGDRPDGDDGPSAARAMIAPSAGARASRVDVAVSASARRRSAGVIGCWRSSPRPDGGSLWWSIVAAAGDDGAAAATPAIATRPPRLAASATVGRARRRVAGRRQPADQRVRRHAAGGRRHAARPRRPGLAAHRARRARGRRCSPIGAAARVTRSRATSSRSSTTSTS